MAVINHCIYLLITIACTVWVGQSLFRNGRVFLIECWGDEQTADAVNRFFLMGFYLLNGAFVFINLRFGSTSETIEGSFETLAGRVGFVALVMGGMHFNNLFWCELARRISDFRAKAGEL